MLIAVCLSVCEQHNSKKLQMDFHESWGISRFKFWNFGIRVKVSGSVCFTRCYLIVIISSHGRIYIRRCGLLLPVE